MVKKILVNELIEDGAKLLEELDHRGFPVDSMFWVDIPEQDYWRLVIGSPLAGSSGQLGAYRKLQEILREKDYTGFGLDDISVFGPDSQELLAFRAIAEQSSRWQIGTTWVGFEDAVVYRWTKAALTAQLSHEISQDQLSEAWETERKYAPLSFPKLLFSVVGRRVTIRLHPQHGPQSTVPNDLKNALERAVHRLNPQCSISWID